MRINPFDLYEMELEIYKQDLAKYEALKDKPYHFMLAKPEQPVIPSGQKHWDMRKVVTSSRRKWK